MQQLQRWVICAGLVSAVYDHAPTSHTLWFFKGGKYASEFACKNYLVLLADILKSKEPSYNALKLVCLYWRVGGENQSVCMTTPFLQQVVKSLSEMCGTSSLTQDLARYSPLIGSRHM